MAHGGRAGGTILGAIVLGAACAIGFAPTWAPAQSNDAAAAGSSLREVSPEAGASVFRRCQACHEIGTASGPKTGPNLTGVVGRPAGSVAGYSYSEANKQAGAKGLVWAEDALSEYLQSPMSFMPGTKKVFIGLKDEQDRKDVIAYLRTFATK